MIPHSWQGRPADRVADGYGLTGKREGFHHIERTALG
jgi:hypothetical protein